MLVNLIALLLTIVTTVRSVSYGVWTIKKKNIIGGIAVILLSATAFSLMGVYFYSLFL